MRVAHEMPISLMEFNLDRFSEYNYVLLHLMNTNERYAKISYEYRDAGGFTLLDNSAYELGGSLKNELLYEHVIGLQPDEFILPDVVGNDEATIKRTFEFLDQYPETTRTPGLHTIAVAQGETREELIDCYKIFRDDHRIHKIGIPFCFPWATWSPQIQADARIELLKELNDNGIIDKNRPHHLLGTWQPREFTFYTEYDWVDTIDTSNPIMCALDGNIYEDDRGPLVKPKMTIDKSLNLNLCEIDLRKVDYNVRRFKDLTNG